MLTVIIIIMNILIAISTTGILLPNPTIEPEIFAVRIMAMNHMLHNVHVHTCVAVTGSYSYHLLTTISEFALL